MEASERRAEFFLVGEFGGMLRVAMNAISTTMMLTLMLTTKTTRTTNGLAGPLSIPPQLGKSK